MYNLYIYIYIEIKYIFLISKYFIFCFSLYIFFLILHPYPPILKSIQTKLKVIPLQKLSLSKIYLPFKTYPPPISASQTARNRIAGMQQDRL